MRPESDDLGVATLVASHAVVITCVFESRVAGRSALYPPVHAGVASESPYGEKDTPPSPTKESARGDIFCLRN